MSDADSLFGSPPPSPSARGRSPSLALPELPPPRPDGPAGSQNVGTIALPGSHERCSELPVFVDLALPSKKPPALSLRPPAPSVPRPPPTRQRVAGSASRRPRSPSRLLSPAPHNSQTDRTLRDLVGLISHFEPTVHTMAQRPPTVAGPVVSPNAPNPHTQLHPPGTAQNPIVVDGPLPIDMPAPGYWKGSADSQSLANSQGPADAVNSALVALAGTVASALKLPTAPKDTPSLSKPTVNSVLHIIKHDPKLIPVLQATYEYLGSVPNQPPPSHATMNTPNTSSKRRRFAMEKGSQVPAGAGHWNVPFPFAPGHGPKDYPSQWQLDRGRRVLGDLLGLFERAFAKARSAKVGTTTATQNGRPKKRRKTGGRSSAQSARSDLESSANGTNDQASVPSGHNKISPLDHKRMNEWLSSVPSLSESSPIVESTDSVPSPPLSDPTPVTDSFQDLFAMLSPNAESSNAMPVDDKDPIFDFDAAFNDMGLDKVDPQWQSLFGSVPVSQSINDITALPIGFQGDLTSQHATRPQSQPQPPLECVIDPALMALSQQPSAFGSSSSVQGDRQSGQTPSTDLDFLSGSDALTSPIPPILQSPAEPLAAEGDSHSGRDLGESVPSDIRLIPTGSTPSVPSVPSSQAPSRRGSVAPTEVYSSSAVSSAPSSKYSKADRKATLLAKAREHRARLLQAIEEAKTERWETIIEGGVLRNLQKVGVP